MAYILYPELGFQEYHDDLLNNHIKHQELDLLENHDLVKNHNANDCQQYRA